MIALLNVTRTIEVEFDDEGFVVSSIDASTGKRFELTDHEMLLAYDEAESTI